MSGYCCGYCCGHCCGHRCGHYYRGKRGQQGVTLLIALIMLLVMTGVGVTLMSGATLQERLAGNNRQLASARINAESALRAAEAYIADLEITNKEKFLNNFIYNESTAGHYYPILPQGIYLSPLEVEFDVSLATAWQGNINDSRQVNLVNAGLSALPPRFIIEYIGTYVAGRYIYSLDQEVKLQENQEPFVFRVTAIGYGVNSNIYTVLQSTYMTRQGNPDQ